MPAMTHPFMHHLRILDRDNLTAVRDDFHETIAYECDGFVLRVGFNKNAPDDSDPMMIVENPATDGLSVTFGGTGD